MALETAEWSAGRATLPLSISHSAIPLPYMRSPSDYISHRAHAVDASGIRKVFDLAAKMKDPINLSIGLPDFDVPEIAKTAAIEAIQSGQNRYTQTQGIAPLRERLRGPAQPGNWPRRRRSADHLRRVGRAVPLDPRDDQPGR